MVPGRRHRHLHPNRITEVRKACPQDWLRCSRKNAFKGRVGCKNDPKRDTLSSLKAVEIIVPDIAWKIISALLAVALVWILVRRRRVGRAHEAECWRTVAEDALKIIGKRERTGKHVDSHVLATVLGISDALSEEIVDVLIRSGWVQRGGEELRLTGSGRRRASELVRIHRLWEQYLVEHEGMPPDSVHEEAHRREHTTTPAEAARLDAELGYPAWDPHGHVIPEPGRPVPDVGGVPLSECPAGRRMRVLHVDDDPPALFAQLAAMGLTPGVIVQTAKKEGERLWVKVEDRSLPLAVSVAGHVHVAPAPSRTVVMGELSPGSRARVVETKGTGRHQRRMLDMGLVPGAEVSVVRVAPLGDPVEYNVKDTAISMRRSDANTVLVEEESGQEDE